MTFKGIIEALGARLGVEIEDAGGAAAVEIDGAAVILQDAGELLLLRAEIGEIPGDGRERFLASAMEANFLYQGTGGATLALDPQTGHLVIQKYNWLERLDAETAFTTLERFADIAATWRRTIVDFSTHDDASAKSSESEHFLSSPTPFMQV